MALEPAAAGDRTARLYAVAGAVVDVAHAKRGLDALVRSRAPRRAIREAEASLARARHDAKPAAGQLGFDCKF